MHVSLISGPLPLIIVAVAGTSLAWSLARPAERWRRRVLAHAFLTGALIVGLALAVERGRLLPGHVPVSFFGWVGLVVFAALVCRAGWDTASGRRRAVSLMAVVATVALAADLVDIHYAYYPTAAAVLGREATDQASPKRLVALRARSEGSGRLPVRGVVVPADFPATTSGFAHRRGFVYLPPAWFGHPRPRLPAVLLLPGTPGLTSDWTRAGAADETADRFAATHGGMAPILVLADQNGSDLGDTECVDGPQGRAETYLTVDVRQWVIATYGASPDADRWAVAGLSEGGTCALVLALRHPELFGALGDFSGGLAPTLGGPARTLHDLFAGSAAAQSAYDPRTLLARRTNPGLTAWFEAGLDDPGGVTVARLLASAARAAGVDAHLELRPGGHNFIVWRAAFEDALPSLAARLGIPVQAQQEVASRASLDGQQSS